MQFIGMNKKFDQEINRVKRCRAKRVARTCITHFDTLRVPI